MSGSSSLPVERLEVEPGPQAPSEPTASRRLRWPRARRVWVHGAQIGIVAAVLAMWQWLPTIESLKSISPVFDPYFVSSPTAVAETVVDLVLARNGSPSLWPYLRDTMVATFIGVGVGTLLGTVFGLLLSSSEVAQQVAKPFIVVLNATPRIALIPFFVIIAGPTLMAGVLTSIFIVFFLVFYNAFAGGMSVPVQSLQNAKLLGGRKWEVMRQVRLQYVIVWTFASLPNAISFGLVGVVTAEILTGQLGMGRLLFDSINNVNAALTFAVVVVLAVVGVILVTATDAAQRRVLHWWERSL